MRENEKKREQLKASRPKTSKISLVQKLQEVHIVEVLVPMKYLGGSPN